MADNKKAIIKRIAAAIRKSSAKFLPIDKLARVVGLYPDVLSDVLVDFDPMIKFDPSINTRDLLPQLEEYLAADAAKPAKPKEKRVVVGKKTLAEYPSIEDFIYKKMTNAGGLFDRSYRLNDEDLALLKKLVTAEAAARKKKKSKK